MIVKGQARGRARQLAAHLLRTDENERIRTYEVRGTLATNVEEALVEMEARAVAARSQQPLYHASISPDPRYRLNDFQIKQAVELLEARLGLHGQPRVVVEHVKKGRQHLHVVWSRIVAETGSAISTSWNYRHHEASARDMEAKFGHVPNKASSVVSSNKERRRPALEYEQQQVTRSGVPTEIISADLTRLWSKSGNGTEFRKRLEEAGYALARGDRRVFVVIDRAGNVHSLARRLTGITTRQLRNHMQDVDLASLPSVSEVRTATSRHRNVHLPNRHRAHFSVAAREISLHRQTGGQAPHDRNVLLSLKNAQAMVGQRLWSTTAVRSADPSRHEAARHARSYRSVRAALIAHYAAKVADLVRLMEGAELVDAIGAMIEERSAALRALAGAGSEAHGARRKRYPRRRRLRAGKAKRTRDQD